MLRFALPAAASIVHPLPVAAAALLGPPPWARMSWDGGGIAQMNIPPSLPTETMILRSGEIRTAATLPLCPVPTFIVKPSS